MSPAGAPPAWLSPLLERVDSNPTTRFSDATVRLLGVEPARVRRYFRKNYGMTFQAYCRGRRLGRSLEQIRNGDDLDDVALGHGYESHSGFRDAFVRTFGRAPGRSRATDCILVAWVESPLGPLIAGATADGICLLEFTDRRMLETQFGTLRRRFGRVIVPGENRHIRTLRQELTGYFRGSTRKFTVPLVHPGTPFQERVWDELLRIPYGSTLSYQELAQRIGRPGASRAVGHANGLNRLAILIPCHRVVNKNGELGGYGGGMWRKARLLAMERGEELP
jgi:AraC family transcriptional regulator of adaptative response/methylated-DNA-[protein]-cysteine methyltransferase